MENHVSEFISGDTVPFFFFFKGHFGWFGIFVLVLLFGVCFLGLVWLGVFLRGLMS